MTTPDGVGPTVADIAAMARLDGIELAEGEAAELQPVIASLTEFDALLERLADEWSLPRSQPHDPGHVPAAAENPYNAFIRRCSVDSGAVGPLSGLTVGIKDNIALAGVPMTNGSRLTPFVPVRDAVVVERILDAGGRIVGTLNMDDFGAAGLGETSAFGPARNPIDPAHSAGGSSGGAGAAVRGGEVDLALGVDQGGSGRIPAAFCGVVAAKATQGLVPSFGVVHIDHTIDTVTPLGRSVADVARLLEVLAGPDARDPQWVRGDLRLGACLGAETAGVQGLRIGLVQESCEPSICEPAVLAAFEVSARACVAAGARVETVSIPLWRDGLAMFLPYIGHLAADMFRTEGQGIGHLGAIDVEAMEAYAAMRRSESLELAKQMKSWIIADRYVHERARGIPYGQLHNLRLALRRQIDAALDEVDLLLTPTLPITAPRLADPSTPFVEVSGRTAARLPFNTAPLNLSGHPAISIPNGADEGGLPTALQIVARRFDEVTAFRAAFELERALSGTLGGA